MIQTRTQARSSEAFSLTDPVRHEGRQHTISIVGPAREDARPTVTTVIPTLNEAKNLPHVLGALPSCVTEVVIVDGHSTDDTVEVATALRPDVKIVMQDGRGKGNALCCGFSEVTGDITVILDADGSTDPGEIPRFVTALLEGADMAKGSRYVDQGGSTDITWFRSLGNRVLVQIVNLLWGTDHSDLCYGYMAFWTHCLDHMNIDCDGFEVETLITVRAAQARLLVAEVPSTEFERLHGESNLRVFRDGMRIARTILRERFSRQLAPARLMAQEGLHPVQ